MITRHDRGKTVWVDLECPTEDEIRDVLKEFDIDERVHEEIFTPTPFPLSIAFPGYSYLILHFPVSGSEDGTRVQEVDFIVGKKFLITARYESIESLHNLHKILEAEELLGLSGRVQPVGEILERVLCRLYTSIGEEIERVAKRLERIERDIFSGKERQTVRAISDAGRVLLRFETSLARHEEPLADFLAALSTPPFFGTNFEEHATKIAGRRTHAKSLASSYRAVSQELRITNDSLLNTSQNEVMKTLTIMAFVTFPLTLISSVFGMNTSYLPLVGKPGDFWIVLGIMIALAASFFAFFRWRRWL